jgi:hypothetical protein
MSEAIQADKYPFFFNFTASTTTTEVQLPNTCRRVTIGCENHKLYISRNGATDGGSLTSNRAFVPSGNYITLSLGKGKERAESIFISTSGAGSADVSLVLEEE